MPRNSRHENNKKLNLTAPGSSLKNRTGTWRTARPKTDYRACLACGLCAKICPEGCIIMAAAKSRTGKTPAKARPVTDYAYCKGCGLCAAECPAKAIKMVKDY